MRYIDTHCHFNFPVFSDNLAQSLHQLRESNLSAVIIPATKATDFSALLALSRQHAELFVALGLHPLWISEHHDNDLIQLENALSSGNQVIAIGEIGVDFYTPQLTALASRQWALLSAQLQLAKAYRLPVILHSRKSHDPLSRLLKESSLPATGVIHGFTGSYQQAKRFIDLGFYLGVGGSITYPRANKTREALARVPIEFLVLETDAPDMPLYGYQGTANRPERVVQVCQALATLRGQPVEEVMAVMWQNSLRLFPQLTAELT
ncbi:TatD family hydrolase [Rosenbergiella australiborealis]|uniref:Metal-dependent hydrolase n=1 Tax=Rosenbergiella australiborealis TaxID=1544696 RepID=A0ABS5T431_9GAMM|nr:TatD family hydrolase [Rosenbergiella australiborealis]MBT0727096.1 metal-dependent hydrolase [Rosenbergiella australiborealis]